MTTDIRKFLLAAILTLLSISVFGQPRLVPQKVTLKSGKTFSLNLAEGFEIVPAAEGLKRVRFFARSPDGRIFVTDMHNLTDNKRGKIYILDDWNKETGKFGKVVEYLSGLHNPNSVQFYKDRDGQDWIYIAETGKLTRRKFTKGEIQPTDDRPQTLATFPDYGLSYKYGGWHLTRTIAFSPNGKLYVSVGSSCNSCVEKEDVRATILEMNPEGSEQRIFAKGLRNAVGLRWFGNFLFATNQGSDHLGTTKPDETFYALAPTTPSAETAATPPQTGGGPRDYGWPYCHSSDGKIFTDPKIKRRAGCSNVTAPYAWFPARSSALGFDYFDDEAAPESIRNAFLVSLHGSTNKVIGHGYKIAIMRRDEPLQDFLTGFLRGRTVNGRPCDILKLSPEAFLLTDDHTGVIYLIRQKGSKPEITETVEAESAIPDPTQTDQAAESGPKACLATALVFAAAMFRRF